MVLFNHIYIWLYDVICDCKNIYIYNNNDNNNNINNNK